MSNNEIKIHSPTIQMNTHQKKPRHVDDTQYIPEPYKKIARSMEEQFANYMISEMEKSTGSSNTGTAESYYKDLQRSERAKQMALENRLGLQNVILDQIYPKQQRSKLAYDAYQKMNENKFGRSNIEMHTVPKPSEIEMAVRNTAEEISHD